MKRVLLVFGTRPEAIKMAPLVHALGEHGRLQPVVCLTAQHREMVDQALAQFDIRPDYDLDLMQPGQTLASLTGRMIEQLGPIFREAAADAVLVQGDTTSTMCGALGAFYHHVPVGHIEAGLRTGDMRAPFPEEMNRVMTTRLATWHFAATNQNRETLLKEGVCPDSVFVTGNTVIDALFLTRDRIDSGDHRDPATAEVIARFPRPYVLITGHRRESFGEGFERICGAIRTLAERHAELDFVYPVHLNPNVQAPVQRTLGGVSNVHLLPPQSYEPFVALMSRARVILTDSGGVQEEAPALGKPTLVMRDKTERVEGLGGGVLLVGTDKRRIVNETQRLLSDSLHYARMAAAASPYGDGSAARRIVARLAAELGEDAGRIICRAA
jgi:UDP-N-acetylglucosamine 2-epimerase (non-hydrolysing)